eukprot:6181978-Pleurochrysis_carterae.AAC.2
MYMIKPLHVQSSAMSKPMSAQQPPEWVDGVAAIARSSRAVRATTRLPRRPARCDAPRSSALICTTGPAAKK